MDCMVSVSSQFGMAIFWCEVQIVSFVSLLLLSYFSSRISLLVAEFISEFPLLSTHRGYASRMLCIVRDRDHPKQVNNLFVDRRRLFRSCYRCETLVEHGWSILPPTLSTLNLGGWWLSLIHTINLTPGLRSWSLPKRPLVLRPHHPSLWVALSNTKRPSTRNDKAQ